MSCNQGWDFSYTDFTVKQGNSVIFNFYGCNCHLHQGLATKVQLEGFHEALNKRIDELQVSRLLICSFAFFPSNCRIN